MNKFSISENAARKINSLNAKEKTSQKMLRVKVEGGGCNGLKYQLDLTDNQEGNDLIFMQKGAKVVIDEISIGFLEDSEIDYVEELGSASFVIRNPNSASKCGCGTSFSYKQ
jgi:iron-sulfur cluster assembly accessory protein